MGLSADAPPTCRAQGVGTPSIRILTPFPPPQSQPLLSPTAPVPFPGQQPPSQSLGGNLGGSGHPSVPGNAPTALPFAPPPSAIPLSMANPLADSIATTFPANPPALPLHGALASSMPPGGLPPPPPHPPGLALPLLGGGSPAAHSPAIVAAVQGSLLPTPGLLAGEISGREGGGGLEVWGGPPLPMHIGMDGGFGVLGLMGGDARSISWAEGYVTPCNPPPLSTQM